MKTISLLHNVVALVVTILIGSYAVTAQNTFTPEPIQTYHSGFWGTDVFADAGSYIVRLRSTHAPGRADLVQHFVVVP